MQWVAEWEHEMHMNVISHKMLYYNGGKSLIYQGEGGRERERERERRWQGKYCRVGTANSGYITSNHSTDCN